MYRVTGVEIPVRTKRETTNAERWKKFSARVERALNRMRNDGFQVQMQILEGHGVLITGVAMQPTFGILDSSSLPPGLREIIEGQRASPSSHSIQEILAAVSTHWTDGMRGDIASAVVNPIVTNHLQGKPQEFVKECLQALDKWVEEHEKGHPPGPCPLRDMTTKVRESIASFIDTNVN